MDLSEKRRPLERAQTSAVLGKLIYTGRKNSDEARIRLTTLGLRVGDKRDTKAASAIENALNGNDWPSPENAWDWGETLRELGISWISGLWMLWAVGHLDDAVGVAFHWAAMQPLQKVPVPLGFEGGQIDEIWHAFALADFLVAPTDVDDVPDLARRMLQSKRLTDEDHAVIWKHAAALEDPEQQRSTYLSYVRHELAKAPWLVVNERKAEFEIAYNTWVKNNRSYDDSKPMAGLARTVLAVASSSDIEFPDRKTATLSVFGQWLTSLELNRTHTLSRHVSDAFCPVAPRNFDGDPRPISTKAWTIEESDEFPDVIRHEPPRRKTAVKKS